MKFILIATLLLPQLALAGAPYPIETRRAFMQSCVGLSKELVQPCRCVLQKLEGSIPADEFEKRLAAGRLDKDPRFASMARQCSGK